MTKLAFVISGKALYKIIISDKIDKLAMTLNKIKLMSEDENLDVGLATKLAPRTEKPKMYKVMLLNDDYTPMEFVVHVLERYFGTSGSLAYELMMVVHQKGLAVVGLFSHDIAETKVTQVMELARKHQHPLQCTMEKD